MYERGCKGIVSIMKFFLPDLPAVPCLWITSPSTSTTQQMKFEAPWMSLTLFAKHVFFLIKLVVIAQTTRNVQLIFLRKIRLVVPCRSGTLDFWLGCVLSQVYYKRWTCGVITIVKITSALPHLLPLMLVKVYLFEQSVPECSSPLSSGALDNEGPCTLEYKCLCGVERAGKVGQVLAGLGRSIKFLLTVPSAHIPNATSVKPVTLHYHGNTIMTQCECIGEVNISNYKDSGSNQNTLHPWMWERRNERSFQWENQELNPDSWMYGPILYNWEH